MNPSPEGATPPPERDGGAEAAAEKVEARVLKGFRDLLPGELLARNRVVDTIRGVYERYGFAPLETPAMEHLDVLLGKYGDEGTRDLFRLETPEGDAAALRFDLTVPLARVVAQYPDLPRPFRRYQVSPVWRCDKPGPGRFREFIQFDIDTVGSSSVAADVEIVAAIVEVFEALKVGGFEIRMSSRRVLDALVRFAGVPDGRAHDVFRVLDKLDRQGLESVQLELTTGRTDPSGDRIPGLGLETSQVDRIVRFLTIDARGRGPVLDAVEALLAGVEGAAEAVCSLRDADAQLLTLGVGPERVRFDPTLARGLAYYTGPIFEAVLTDVPELGSVFGGGRYDGLVERFLGTKVPAVGGSVGVDRLVQALLKLKAMTLRLSPTRVLVTVLDMSVFAEYQKIARELRGAGIATEVFLGDARGLKKQLAYADKIGAEVAILMGGDELARGEVSVKDLVEGARHGAETQGREAYLTARFGQRAVPRADLLATVRSLLDDGRAR